MSKEDEITICSKCEFYRAYRFYCGGESNICHATTKDLGTSIDYVTGRILNLGTTGKVNCKDRNKDGKCKYYKRRD